MTKQQGRRNIQRTMNRIAVTLLVIVSLAFAGVANAFAANDCPYLKAPVSHDCCPPDGDHQSGDTSGDSKSKMDCKLGQACRTVAAVTPSLPPLSSLSVVVADDHAAADAPAVRPGPPFALWKPPRSV